MNNKTINISQEQIEQQYGFMRLVRERNNVFFAENGRLPRVYVLTFGCQQNEADSEYLAGMSIEMGYEKTEDAERADLILVNTCAVREHAELRALSITGQFKHLKKANRNLKIGICGCMVTQEHRKDDIKNKYPYVDFLFGTNMLWRFPEILNESFDRKKRLFYFDHESSNVWEGLPVKRESDFKAWISVMYGCNNFCSYCVVPYVRGRERSRQPNKILKQIKDLADKGYKEFTLLGQNVNSYGKDLNIDYDFSDLLTDICKIDGDFWVRFMTSHPKDASRKLIDTMAREEKIVKHLHLPFQAGNDRVLKVMNRKYDSNGYFELVSYAKEKIHNVGLTSDVIVGFPTETDEEFEDTLEMLRKVEFDSVYSFIYSPRKDTPAASMEGQIPDEVKKMRFAKLLEVQNSITKDLNSEYVGKTIKILVEGKSKSDTDKYTGRNEKNRIVHIDGDDSLIGKFLQVRIDKADTFAMYGTVIN
ncbi:MAG: tRNA (N6-isopentenyl adenosine(37)-C2)-methylthiotransferase MiaB [Ruminococcaceae bacterium]|nr:tRNA (N6-isopentenyl adenosine(37)-C2)-methylthiotransferase MiaB [Oscillospiraceae bacterium]